MPNGGDALHTIPEGDGPPVQLDGAGERATQGAQPAGTLACSEADVSREIVEKNPIIDYATNICIAFSGSLSINIKDQGAQEYTDAEELEKDYLSGKIHPSDLKPAVTTAINTILQPVRDHFSSGEPKKLLEKVKKFKITR